MQRSTLPGFARSRGARVTALALAVWLAVSSTAASAGVPFWQRVLRWMSGESSDTPVAITMMCPHLQISLRQPPRPDDAARAEAVRSMQATPRRVTFCGHMHEPKLYHLAATGKAGDFTPTSGMAIPLLPHRQWLVIPGSAGQPRDGDPAACYAVYDDASGELTYWRVPYDTEGAGAKIRAAQLPQRLAARLADGE